MKRIASFLLATSLAAFAALPAAAMTWSINPGNSNQIVDDTGSWTLTLSAFNQTYDGVQYQGKEVSASAYTENGANGILDLTTAEADTGYKIVSIGNNRWDSNTALKEVYLPDTIAYIGRQVFRNDTALTIVKLPNVFCRWHSDGGHFSGCSALTTIYYTGVEPEEGIAKVPPSVKVLPYYFLGGCTSVRRVEAPGVEITYNRALPAMTALESVSFSPNLRAVLNNNNWTQTLFHNDQTYLANIVDFYPSVFVADFQIVPTSLSVTNGTTTSTLTVTGAGMFANTAITNYLDFSACSFDTIPSLAFFKTAIAGATIPATVTAIKDQAFKQLRKTATIRYLGAPPTFDNQGQNSDNVPFRNNNANNSGYTYNTVGFRHVFVVDAEAYPAWTNQYFVSVADIKASSDSNVKNYQAAVNDPTDSSQDFPTPKHPEETLGITNYGHRPNEYAWLVQYVDHSTVTATWMNDGATYDTTTVATGSAPTAPDGTPARASTPEFDYTFLGWNTDPDAAAALDLSTLALDDDTVFYAIYSASTRSYTVTWQMDDGTDIDTTTVAYGGTPAHSDASKPGDGTYTYSFSGWSTDGATVLDLASETIVGATTYIAVFEQHEASTTATVSWFDEDGTTALDPATTTVTKGAQPTHAEPTKAPTIETAYTFAGWVEVGSDGSVTNATADLPAVSADIAYKAAYTAATRQYTVMFANWDGAVVSAIAYDYGTASNAIAIPADPTRPATAEYTYAFTGWTPAVADVTGDATYTAAYAETANSYDATFVDGIDNSTIEGPTSYAYGAEVTAPAAPEHYGYTFSAWSPAVSTMPAANTTYTALYTTNSYTITWVNGDTTTTASYPYHTAAESITVPAGKKTETTKATYTFLAWTPALEAVESNTTYTATFSATLLDPMVLLYDGTEVASDISGATISAHLSNYTTTAEGFSAGVPAVVRSQTQVVGDAAGTATFSAPNVTATFTALDGAKGYEWTLAATQTVAAAGLVDVATLHGRFWAKPSKEWFTAEQAVFDTNGVFRPTTPSGAGQQVRLHATMTFPAIPSRVHPDATGAVTGIDVYQPNAGRPLAYYAWNGAEWVRLCGAVAKLGEPVELLGVIDFAVSGGAMTWYAGGVELTDEDGEWSIPMSLGPKQIASFLFDSETATLDSLAGDYDLGFNGTLLLIH